MTLPELAAANLPLYTLAWSTAALLLGWWARGVRNRYGVTVGRDTARGTTWSDGTTDEPTIGWRVYLRRAAVGPLRARREAAQADAERLEGEL